MSHVIITLAQFVYILWPMFIMATLIYSFQVSSAARRPRRGKLLAALGRFIKHVRRNLLITWLLLACFWVVSLFAPGDTPGLLPDPWNTIVFLGGLALLLVFEISELKLFPRRLRAHIDIHHAVAIQDLKAMDPYDFEALVAETYAALGYSVQHVGHSGDHGIDVALRTQSGEDWVVQCKRYHGSVGEGYIRELYGTMIAEKAERAVLVTTAEITPPARTWARGKPIDLVDGVAFLKLVARARQQARGTLLDRVALFLEGLFSPAPTRPAGLRKSIQPAPASLAAPVGLVIYSRGAPVCPNCRVPMRLHPRYTAGLNGHAPGGPALYRCRNYPACRVALPGKENPGLRIDA